MIPDSGMPDAMPLAMTRMSGGAPVHSLAQMRPVRPIAGLHLVDDEQDAVPVGDLAQRRQEAVRRDDVAALAEDRLDQERGHVVGVDDVANSSSSAARLYASAASSDAPVGLRSGYGKGAKCTPPSSGSKWPRYLTPELVSAMAPWVRPWKPPRKAMIPGRRVAYLASLTAASIASAPEFDRKSPASSPCARPGKVRGSRSCSSRPGWW